MTRRADETRGKPFTKGDPRINRTIPGPGRPPIWWKHELAKHEKNAIDLIGGAIEQGQERLKDRGEKAKELRRVHLAAALSVIEHLHGKPTIPIEVVPQYDMSRLTDKELDDLGNLFKKVGIVYPDGSGMTQKVSHSGAPDSVWEVLGSNHDGQLGTPPRCALSVRPLSDGTWARELRPRHDGRE